MQNSVMSVGKRKGWIRATIGVGLYLLAILVMLSILDALH